MKPTKRQAAFIKAAERLKKVKTISAEWLIEPLWNDTIRHIRKKALGGKARLTALEVLALEDVPLDRRLWAVLWEGPSSAAVLHEFACRCAEHVLSRADSIDPRSAAAIETKRRWVRGEASDKELEAAGHAAWVAAGPAEWPGGWIGKWCAPYAATYVDAGTAARMAAEFDVREAPFGAKRDEVRRWQAELLRTLLEGTSAELIGPLSHWRNCYPGQVGGKNHV